MSCAGYGTLKFTPPPRGYQLLRASFLYPQGGRERRNTWMGSSILRSKPWSFKMKAVSVNKEVLALIGKMPETGFVPKCDNVVVFGDRFFGLAWCRRRYTAPLIRNGPPFCMRKAAVTATGPLSCFVFLCCKVPIKWTRVYGRIPFPIVLLKEQC